MRTILTYVRPWNVEQFEHIANLVWPDAKIHSVSEHPSVDECGLKDSFYTQFKHADKLAASTRLSEELIADIILRCRLLRAIPEQKARRMVFAMEAAIRERLDKYKPEAILSITVDSYVLHLLDHIASEQKIDFIGLVPSFVNGYFRVTSQGEKNGKRAVQTSEIDATLSLLLKSGYKPNFLAGSTDIMRKRARKRWARNLIKPFWFRFKRLISGDPLNYHYYSTQIVAERYWSLTPHIYSDPKKEFEVASLQGARSRSHIFFPLQMSPEATIDYWSADNRWVEYEDNVLKIIEKYSDKVTFLIKEHPNVVGMRSGSFYKRLNDAKSCIIIPAQVDSNAVLLSSDGVLICTGTVGFEAALRGIPVYSESEPFHLQTSMMKPLADMGAADPDAKIDTPSKVQTEAMAMYLLEGLLSGHFINDGSWRKGNRSHIEANRVIANSLREYLTDNLN